MCVESIMIALIRSEICGDPTNIDWRSELTTEKYKDLLILSRKHDLSHIVASALSRAAYLGDDEISRAFHQEFMRAVYRDAQRNCAINLTNELLEQAHIPFMPLKGSVIQKRYPEEWMRTSCDIDVLVHEENSEKAKSILVDEYGYVYHGKGSHDISLFAPTNVHVELHYDLIEDGTANESSQVLKNVWNMSAVREGFSFWHEMSDECYYFYHIAHMAKHFENGGCGIRPFIDLYILDSIVEADTERRDTLLKRGRLLKFANACRKLSRIWLSNEQHDPISKRMEDYILGGGVYGTYENSITVQQQKRGGRTKYALSKIFIPYNVIKFHYPILQKHRWLTPFMEVRRWFKLIFCGHAKRTLNELKYNQAISADTADKTKKFIEDIGL